MSVLRSIRVTLFYQEAMTKISGDLRCSERSK